MSSRGSKAINKHVTTHEYRESHKVYEASVLVGNNGNHGLPDYAHTPNRIYIKENHDGSFRELRVYDSSGKYVLEIAYHTETALTGNAHVKVLHYHIIGDDLSRSPAKPLTDELRKKYDKYLRRYGL